jgi:hypothetical protein
VALALLLTHSMADPSGLSNALSFSETVACWSLAIFGRWKPFAFALLRKLTASVFIFVITFWLSLFAYTLSRDVTARLDVLPFTLALLLLHLTTLFLFFCLYIQPAQHTHL